MSLFSSPARSITCDIDLERSDDSFHAYAVPDGVEIRAGDSVRIHAMPTHLEHGELRRYRTAATWVQAGWLRRVWTEFTCVFALTSLYEVGFLPAEELILQPRNVA